MSSWPGPRLEDYLIDCYLWPTNIGWPIVERIAGELTVALFGPYRRLVEDVILENYDEDNSGWRDYRNATGYYIPDEVWSVGWSFIQMRIELLNAPYGGQEPDG